MAAHLCTDKINNYLFLSTKNREFEKIQLLKLWNSFNKVMNLQNVPKTFLVLISFNDYLSSIFFHLIPNYLKGKF